MIISGFASQFPSWRMPLQPIVRETDTSAVTPGSADQSDNSSPLVPRGFETAYTGTDPQSPDSQSNDRTNDRYQTADPPYSRDSLTASEKQLVQELKETDQAVRRHEMAHVAAGGRYITSGANFGFRRGPDGKNYAVSGEVSIDTSPVPGDPEATVSKMRQVKQAALAPADPSPQDIKVASMATALAAKAMAELMLQQAAQRSEANENQAFGSLKGSARTYARVGSLPETDQSTVDIAV